MCTFFWLIIYTLGGQVGETIEEKNTFWEKLRIFLIYFGHISIKSVDLFWQTLHKVRFFEIMTILLWIPFSMQGRNHFALL